MKNLPPINNYEITVKYYATASAKMYAKLPGTYQGMSQAEAIERAYAANQSVYPVKTRYTAKIKTI